ncbi:unnamed protein product [Caretta caretta]
MLIRSDIVPEAALSAYCLSFPSGKQNTELPHRLIIKPVKCFEVLGCEVLCHFHTLQSTNYGLGDCSVITSFLHVDTCSERDPLLVTSVMSKDTISPW